METPDNSFLRYWIGYGVDYSTPWVDLSDGVGYEQKFLSSRPYLLRITFKQYPYSSPLFNFEAIYKTIKGAFHDIKKQSLNDAQYQDSNPIYLHQVRRRSEIWEWLASDLVPLLLLAYPLALATLNFGKSVSEIERNKSETQKNNWETASHINKILKDFPDASQEDINLLLSAKTSRQITEALRKLADQGVAKVAVSKLPITKTAGGRKEMVNLTSRSRQTRRQRK